MSGADLTITTLTTNGATIAIDGSNDVTITAVADSGTDSGTIDASALAGVLTVSSVAADNDLVVKLGTGNGSVTTAASYTADLVVEGQAGDDEVVAKNTSGTVTAILGEGDNTVTAASIAGGTLVVTAGAGDDTVDVSNSGAGTLTTGTVNLSLGDGANTVTLADGAGVSDVTIVTGAGADTVEITATGAGADKLNINLGEGTDDVLYLSVDGADLSAKTVTLAGVETIEVAAENDADAADFTATFKSAVLSGMTYAVKADGYNAASTTDIKVVAAATTTAVDLSKLVVDQSVTGAIGSFTIDAATNAPTAAVTITGSTIADNIFGSAFADTIVGGKGADTITGNDGNDSIDVTEVTGSRSVDNVILNAAGDGVDTITGFKIAEDTITFGDATEQGAAGAAEMGTTAETVAAGGTFDMSDVDAETNDIIEIAATLSSFGDLDLATDGTELLKALSSSSTAATNLVIDDATDNGADVFVVAYQDSKAYVYFVSAADDGVANTSTTAAAADITLVGVLNNVTAGALTAAEFVAV